MADWFFMVGVVADMKDSSNCSPPHAPRAERSFQECPNFFPAGTTQPYRTVAGNGADLGGGVAGTVSGAQILAWPRMQPICRSAFNRAKPSNRLASHLALLIDQMWRQPEKALGAFDATLPRKQCRRITWAALGP